MAEVRGLDWDIAEYLLRFSADTYLHEARDPHGKWAKTGTTVADGAAHATTTTTPPRAEGGFGHTPTLVGLSRPMTAGGAPAAPSTAELAAQIADLRETLEKRTRALSAVDSHHVLKVAADLSDNQRRIQDLSAMKEANARHHDLLHSMLTVFGLLAAGLLIIATAGQALPPMAAAGVAVGPPIMGELAALLHGHKYTHAEEKESHDVHKFTGPEA